MSPIVEVSALDEEQQAQQWEKLFNELIEFIQPRFARSEAQERARNYLEGLLSQVERKNSWQLAEQAGALNPYGIQHLLGRAVWDADGLRDDLRLYVKEYLFTPEGVGVFDETGFIKKGTQSVGVQRQYSGTAGKVENCQIGVFLTYVSEKGHTFIDRELYLPQSWASDPERCHKAGVPKARKFATKPALAQEMFERARADGMSFAWMTGDEVYGNHAGLREHLEQQRQAYILAVSCTQRVSLPDGPLKADEGGQRCAPEDWQRLSAGNGTKGPRLYDWARVQLEEETPPGWSKYLLLRRNLKDPQEQAYYRVFAPIGTSLAQMVKVAGCRWTVEECFEGGKGEVGLDQYEVRSWTGWYRHITLCCLAHAFLSVVQAQSQQEGEKNQKFVKIQPPLTHSLATFKQKRGL